MANLITNYYNKSKLTTMAVEEKSALIKIPTLKRQMKDGDIIDICDSDSDLEVTNEPNLTQKSNSSCETVLYSPTTPSKSSIMPSPGSSNESVSPSKKLKFFSPNKKKNVTLKTPQKTPRSLSLKKTLFTTNIVQEQYAKAYLEADDKTKFLLTIVNDFLQDESLKKLLCEESVNLLSSYFNLPSPAIKLVHKLFWRKEGWYKVNEINKIIAGKTGETLNENSLQVVLNELVDKRFLINGTEENLTFEEYTKILNADDLKDICKTLKLNVQSKKNSITALEAFSKRKSILQFFKPADNNSSSDISNNKRVLNLMCKKVGACNRLSDLARTTIERLHILMYLGIDYDIIRQKNLDFMLINEKIGRETFPIDDKMKIDNAGIVFNRKDEFDGYLIAHSLYESFIQNTKTEERCDTLKLTFELYNNIDVETLIRYKTLPTWLQRYTPEYIYIKLLEEGLPDLKKDKNEDNCTFAINVISLLLNQTFREHKKAEWYNEKALILHTYLHSPEQAALVLIEGFESKILSDTQKDCMRPRAKKYAQQKNVQIDTDIRQKLLHYSVKECIQENNIPSRHYFKQQLYNPTKGKAMYETKSKEGRNVHGVEEYALSRYILDGDYTHGEHWEGRIITTIFFLIFWEVIYAKPKNAQGIFLSRFQRFPADLFYPEFYLNRREPFEIRLKFIEQCTVNDMISIMLTTWEKRPESELSGISRDIGWEKLQQVATCLGPVRVASICRRLAQDYRYTHSGFPDLTLWNVHNNQIIFVEVKSDSDKPSMKQIQWLQYLIQNDVKAEFCYVGANTKKNKARLSVPGSQ